MNGKLRFSQYGQKLRQSFPTWSKIRKDPNSIGAQFLAVIGLRLDDIEWMLEYAYDQVYIGKADINHVDVIYKARIPNSLKPDMNYRFSSYSHILHPVKNELEFLQNTKSVSHHPSIQYDTAYFLDFEDKYIYVRQPFGQSEDYKSGYVILTILNGEEDEIWSEPIPLMIHHIWNFFDEFGLLLGLPRLHGEKNVDYKERLLDVFRRPASSTYRGLINGIARELEMVRQTPWPDPTKDFTLQAPRIDEESIHVNNQPFTNLYHDESGRVVLKGSSDFGTSTVTIRYIAGITLHELHDKEDVALRKVLYNQDGSATSALKHYVKDILNHVPIMWGQWKWNQGFWNIADENMSGFGYLPVMYDGSFAGWKTYKPKEG